MFFAQRVMKLASTLLLCAAPLLVGCTTPFKSFTTENEAGKIVHFCAPITELVAQDDVKKLMGKFFNTMSDSAAKKLETTSGHVTFSEEVTSKDAHPSELSSQDSWYCYNFWLANTDKK